MPTVNTDDLSGQPLTPAEHRLTDAAGETELALLNALLAVEHEMADHEFAALERLLGYCQFADGALDARLLALPDRAFAAAALDLYELGWVNTNNED
jgi:hypothetical protein